MFLVICKELTINDELAFDYCQRLIDYKYVDELHELTIGKYIRWIRKPTEYHNVTPTISPGGIINEIIFI